MPGEARNLGRLGQLSRQARTVRHTKTSSGQAKPRSRQIPVKTGRHARPEEARHAGRPGLAWSKSLTAWPPLCPSWSSLPSCMPASAYLHLPALPNSPAGLLASLRLNTCLHVWNRLSVGVGSTTHWGGGDDRSGGCSDICSLGRRGSASHCGGGYDR